MFCLQISNVPKTVTNEGIKSAFSPYGASKGIWTGHLQSLGIVILAFHDLRHAENACRAVRSGKAHIVLGGVLRAIQLHSGFISVTEARDVGADVISLMYHSYTFTAHGQSLSRDGD
jgi:RNA recognition motif-containing protein